MIPNGGVDGKLEALKLYILPLVVVLVGVGAFGLGRLSAAPGHQALRIVYPDAKVALPTTQAQTAAVANAAVGNPSSAQATQGNYVASKNGTKYYLTTCSGVSRIKDENKVYFSSAAKAVAAGYGPAANCPGL